MAWRWFWTVVATVFLGISMWLKAPPSPDVKLQAASVKRQSKANTAPQVIRPLSAAQIPLEDWIREDRHCDAAQIKMNDLSLQRRFLRALGLEQDVRFQELVSENSPFFVDAQNEKFVTREARFFQALQMADQLEGGMRPVLKDAQRAIQILEELENEDPGNAAYTLYRLSIEANLDYPLEDQLRTASQLDERARFETPDIALKREVLQRSSRSATLYTLAKSWLESAPTPAFALLARAVNEIELELPDFATVAATVLTRNGLESYESAERYGYSHIQYTIGRKIAPWLSLPTTEELEAKIPEPRGWPAPAASDCTNSPSIDRLANLNASDSP